MKIWFDRREQLAPTIWQYYFRPERAVRFVPGQYADFHVLQPLNDRRGQMRTFTLTSLPADNEISFVIKILADCSPYKQALQTLMTSDELRLDDPMGDLVLPKDPSIPLVFIAGGIGIASFVSMLLQLQQRKEERDVFLFYALRSRAEQIFQSATNAYPLQLFQKVLAPNRLTSEEVTSSTPPNALFYLSGSQQFVEGLRTDLENQGVPHEQIIFDYFDGYAEL